MSGTIEVLYYSLYNAVLLGNSDDARMYLDLLRREYEEDDDSFTCLRADGRWDHLLKLSDAVRDGLTVKNFEYRDEAVESPDKDDDQVETERELVRMICEDASQLGRLLHASDGFYIYNLEHPTRYGKIDVVVFDDLTAFVIEVKKSHARYSVISQIDKYLLDFKLKLILKCWNKIVGVVIANGYIGNVVSELVKLGVVPIKYKFRHGTLRLRKCQRDAS